MSSLTFEPLIAPVLWVTLAVTAAALWAWYAWNRPPAVPRRRWSIAIALMALGSAAVLLILLNPTWLEPVPPPAGKPLLTVLVDGSASMATADHADGRTRYAVAADIARRLPDELRPRFDVRVLSFSQTAAPAGTRRAAGVSLRVPTRKLTHPARWGEQTDLAAALSGGITEDRPQGQALFVLSDGAHNGTGGIARLLDELRTLRAMNVPVYTTTLGSDTRLNDLEISVRRPQELAFAGQNVPIDVRVRQRGGLARQAEVVLLEDGQEIDSRTVELAANESTDVEFHVSRDRRGLYRLQARIEPIEDEATTANNAGTLLLRVIEEPVRVLLLEGKPYWDAKFLIRTIASDPSVELDSLVRLSQTRFIKRSLRLERGAGSEAAADGNQRDGETATPQGEAERERGREAESDRDASAAADAVRRTEATSIIEDPAVFLGDPQLLDDYQVVVLGRDSEVFLDEPMLQRLRDWISRDGGSLVCYRGSPVARVNQQLARLLPVRWSQARESRFRIELTERGASLSWLGAVGGWGRAGGESPDRREPGTALRSDASQTSGALSRLPSLATLTRPEPPKPMAVVLAKSQGSGGPPVVTYQPYGTGRVVALEGAGMWRWAFLPPQYREHDEVYGSLWQSLLRWLVSGVGLAPGQDLALRTDKVSYVSGESVTAVLLMREEVEQDEVPEVELTRTDAGDDGTQRYKPLPLGEEPGVYRVPFGHLGEGRYRARVLTAGAEQSVPTATAAFEVRPFAGERLDVAARPDVMARIAAETDGATIQPTEASTLAEQFQQHMARSRPERVRRLSAWDRWWILLGVLAVWTTAWGLRRSAGLI